jgi:tRNA pseudouridine38-40 synthase
MQRYFVELAYRGTAYHGWQIQPNAVTIQQVLNEKISARLGEDIYCVGCGRTDTGVHARRFFMHFDADKPLPPDFILKMNAFLPRDIVFYRLFPVAADAHSRFDAIQRTYKYILSRRKDPFMLDYCGFHFGDLKVEKMMQAAGILLNYTDFQALSKASDEQEHHLCNISHSQWIEKKDKLIYTVSSNRFLRGMVRIIVGTLLEVGKGKFTVEDFEHIIRQRDRKLAGGAAPAQGLYLSEVIYPPGLFSTDF